MPRMTVLEPLHRTIRPSPAFPEVRSRASALRRWTINGDFVTLAANGVARYASEVASALDDLVAEGHVLTKDVELDMVVPQEVGHSVALRAIAIRTVPEFSKPRLPQVWVQLQLPRHVPGGLISLCNLAPLSVRRQIVCIHDLQTRLVPESFGRMFRLAHRVLLPALGRRVAGVTTVSALSCQHLIDFGVARAEKITVTFNGCDHAMRWNAALGSLAPARRPYVLCIGRTLKYKNLDLLLRLAPELDAIGVDLWMAGDVDFDKDRRRGIAAGESATAWSDQRRRFRASTFGRPGLSPPVAYRRLRAARGGGDGFRVSSCRLHFPVSAGGLRRCCVVRGPRRCRRLDRGRGTFAEGADASTAASGLRACARRHLFLAPGCGAIP